MTPYLKSSSGARNAKSKSGSTSNVSIITFAKQLDNSRNLAGILEEKEGERSNSGTAHVVGCIGNGDMEKLADSSIVGSACISQCQGVYTTISKNGVLKPEFSTLFSLNGK